MEIALLMVACVVVVTPLVIGGIVAWAMQARVFSGKHINYDGPAADALTTEELSREEPAPVPIEYTNQGRSDAAELSEDEMLAWEELTRVSWNMTPRQ